MSGSTATKAKDKASKSTQGKSTDAEVIDLPSEETTTDEAPREPKRYFSRAAKATGRGLHTAGSSIADFNLRKVGKAAKNVGHRLPRIEIVRAEDKES